MAMKWMSRAALAVVLASAAVATVAVAADPTPIQQARRGHFKEINKAFKAAREELAKPAPSAAVLQASGKTIDELVAQIPSWFPAGSGPESGKTEALPAIWQKPDEFKAAVAKATTAAHAFNVATQSGNAEAVKAAVPALGGSCKNCHENFKAKDEH